MAFECFCIVEIMGHQVIAGKVSEETHFGSPLMRVDVPKTSKRDSFTVYYGGNSIYKITPTTEQICVAFVEKQEPEPIKPYMLALPTMAAKVGIDEDAHYYPDPSDGYGDYQDDDDEDDYDPQYDPEPDSDDDDAPIFDPAKEPAPPRFDDGLRFLKNFPREADSSGNGVPDDGPDEIAIMNVLEQKADADKAAEVDEVKPE